MTSDDIAKLRDRLDTACARGDREEVPRLSVQLAHALITAGDINAAKAVLAETAAYEERARRPIDDEPTVYVEHEGRASLSHDEILLLHNAAVVAGLPASRGALLAGLDPALIASLPVANSPVAQCLEDLQE